MQSQAFKALSDARKNKSQTSYCFLSFLLMFIYYTLLEPQGQFDVTPNTPPPPPFFLFKKGINNKIIYYINKNI